MTSIHLTTVTAVARPFGIKCPPSRPLRRMMMRGALVKATVDSRKKHRDPDQSRTQNNEDRWLTPRSWTRWEINLGLTLWIKLGNRLSPRKVRIHQISHLLYFSLMNKRSRKRTRCSLPPLFTRLESNRRSISRNKRLTRAQSNNQSHRRWSLGYT